LEALEHRDLRARLDSQEFEVNEVIQDPLEHLDNQETQVFRELPGIQEFPEVLVLLVHQALAVSWVFLV